MKSNATPRGKWIVNAKGGPDSRDFEITVIRDDNETGLRSYGWIDENKILISTSGGPCNWPVTELVWHKLIRIAEEVAQELNQKLPTTLK